MTNVPSFNGAFCQPNQMKIYWIKLSLRVWQIICFASSTPLNHARKPICFPSRTKRTSRRHGQAQVNVLMWPTRCLTEGAAGPHWGRQPYSITVFRQPETLPNCKGEATVFRKMPSFQDRKIDPRSARLNKVPAQTWSRQTPISHPIQKQKSAYDDKHMPKQHGNMKYSIQTNTQLPANTWKLTFKNKGMSSGLRDHTWTWCLQLCTLPNTQTPSIHSWWDFELHLLLAACGSMFLHMPCWGHNEGQTSGQSKSSDKQTNQPKKWYVSRQRTPTPAAKVWRALPWQPNLGYTILLQCCLTRRVASQSETSTPWPDIMNTYDENLAHNMRKQKITEKMRAVFRPLLKQTIHRQFTDN